MATEFQTRSLQRKFVYLGCIVALFALCYGWRTANITLPGGYVFLGVEPLAEKLALTEKNRGEVELTSSAVRLLLTGSKGLAVCGLWITAQEKQKKNQWNELEMVIRSATKLQPHFVEPWLHHTWNLSYNVSVEMHDLRDMYFYVSRGIELMAEGERRNLNHPKLRWAIGMYYQHKINQSDKTSTMRSLMQLSCINPAKRDPGLFQWQSPDGRVNGFRDTKLYCDAHPNDGDAKSRLATMWKNFEDFVIEHPQLVRRLREGMRGKANDARKQFKCESPDEIVRYLIDNRRIPSYFEDLPEGATPDPNKETLPKPREDRFPLLPPGPGPLRPKMFDDTDLTWDSTLDDSVDAYRIGRAWYGYAQEPLPDPDPDMPGENTPIKDPTRQRSAPYTTVIFRSNPARSQSFVGERLEDEGWFDGAGWKILGWFPNDRFSTGDTALIGAGVPWAANAWRKARAMWDRFGQENGCLYPSEESKTRTKTLAELWLKSNDIQAGMNPGTEPSATTNPSAHGQWKAYMFIWLQSSAVRMTNFTYHHFRCGAELEPETIQVRKKFYEAEDFRLKARRDQAIAAYEVALQLWKEMVKKHPDFREDQAEEEDTYEAELRYVQLLQDKIGRQLKQASVLSGYLGQAVARSAGSPDWPTLAQLDRIDSLPRVRIQGPIDGYLDETTKTPWISDRFKDLVHNRRPGLLGGLPPPPKLEAEQPQMMPPPGANRGNMQPPQP